MTSDLIKTAKKTYNEMINSFNTFVKFAKDNKIPKDGYEQLDKFEKELYDNYWQNFEITLENMSKDLEEYKQQINEFDPDYNIEDVFYHLHHRFSISRSIAFDRMLEYDTIRFIILMSMTNTSIFNSLSNKIDNLENEIKILKKQLNHKSRA